MRKRVIVAASLACLSGCSAPAIYWDAGDVSVDAGPDADRPEDEPPLAFPPVVDVTSPERGTFTESTSGSVRGTVSAGLAPVVAVEVNGEPVDVGPDDAFEAPVSYHFGTNLVETIATDEDDFRGTDRRAVLQGGFAPRGSAVGQGIISRINPSGVDSLETFIEDGIDDYDLSGLFPYLATSEESESCVLGVCVTWYALDVWVDSLRWTSTEVEIDPRDDGSIISVTTLGGVQVDWSATGTVAEVDYDTAGTISADSVEIAARMTPSVTDGRIRVAVTDADVTSRGFVFDWDSWINDAASFFGMDVSAMVQEEIESTMEEMVATTMPETLEEFLQDLELGTSFDVFDNSYAISAVPREVAVDDEGLTLVLDTSVDPAEWRSPRVGLGSLAAGYSTPTFETTPGVVLSFSADFLCQTFYALWGGGALSGTTTVAEAGVDPTDLSVLLPSLADVEVITFDALLPPVVVPAVGDELADLQLGDLEIRLCSAEPCGPSTTLLREFIGIEADLDIQVTERATLATSISDVRGWIDVTEPVAPDAFEEQTETLLTALLPVISSQISEALEEVPIPTTYGLTMTDLSFAPAGAEGGYFNAAGELVAPETRR